MAVVAQPHSSALADLLPSLDQARYSLARQVCGFDRKQHTDSCVADIPLSQSDARLTVPLAAPAQLQAHLLASRFPQFRQTLGRTIS